MSIKPPTTTAASLLGGCIYTETPYECMAVTDSPARSETTINKNVIVSASSGMTVIY